MGGGFLLLSMGVGDDISFSGAISLSIEEGGNADEPLGTRSRSI